MVTHTDIKVGGWMKKLPPSWRPYAQLARFDRPIGWLLLLLPAWWSILTAGIVLDAAIPHVFMLMVLFLFGAIIMRGAGCVINDLWDRDIDKMVARTRDRALAAGLITPFNAFVFLAFLALLGLGVLMQLPATALYTGVISLPLIIIYPLAKRWIALPQVILSLTFGWGALLGWAGYGVLPDAHAIILYAAAAFWIFGYDTIYAIQDMADDRKNAIKSSAITLGNGLKPVVALCYAMTILGVLLAGAWRDAGFIYYLGAAAMGLQFKWQIGQINLRAPEKAGVIFRSNRNAGLILTIALMVEFIS
ncbi:MAG: 4-hydroxybenzoate octaprenyltransferase [Candidatus Puniceispirillales bacterium WSBS_2018_MAG_OTU23]